MTQIALGRSIVVLAVVVAAELIGLGQATQAPPLQVPGAIRSRVTLVPVDVYVTDYAGRPITNLKDTDFTILEDGVAQKISAFTTHDFRRGTATKPVAAAPTPTSSATPPGRTFLILLGRGRLDEPSHGLAALDDFLRTGLGPGDRVSLMAYTRVTDATTDRESIRRLLDRYRARYRWIEMQMVTWFTGLQVLIDGPVIPSHIQRDIDAIFAAEGLPRLRDLPIMEPPGDFQFMDIRRWVMKAADPFNDPEDEEDPRFGVAMRQDFEALYNGIEYLRLAPGPRHIVYVTENPMPYREDDYARLAEVANDADVSVWPLQTGGNSLGGLYAPRIGTPSFIRQPLAMFQLPRALRGFAEDTGGRASIQQFATKGLERLESSTRFQYMLGFYPAHGSSDGRYHRLDVRVNRKDVEVSHRGGYFARDRFIPTDERTFLSNLRLNAGASYWRDIKDIPLTWQDAPATLDTQAARVTVRASIDPSGIVFEGAKEDDARTASLDVAVFAIDGGGRPVGETRQTMDLKFDAARLDELKKSGIPYAATVAVKGDISAVREVRLTVYQFSVDRLGSIAAKVK